MLWVWCWYESIVVDNDQSITRASLLHEQVFTRGWNLLFTIREGNLGGGAWYLKAAPLLLSTHGSCPNLAFIQSHTSKCWLHWEDSKVRHDLGHFWHQIHASYPNQRPDPCRFGHRVRWGPCRKWIKRTPHGWKISWPSYGARTIAMEGIRGWGSEPKRIWHGASLDLTWKTHRGKVVKARLFSHEQWGQVWSIIGRNVHGLEDGGKVGYNILGFKAGRRSSEERIRGKGWENARVFNSNQAFATEVWIIQPTTHP